MSAAIGCAPASASPTSASVSSSEAAAYFFANIPQVERGSGRDSPVSPFPRCSPMIQARCRVDFAGAANDSRLQETRRQAIQWIGLLGDATVVPVLVSFCSRRWAEPAVTTSM